MFAIIINFVVVLKFVSYSFTLNTFTTAFHEKLLNFQFFINFNIINIFFLENDKYLTVSIFKHTNLNKKMMGY